VPSSSYASFISSVPKVTDDQNERAFDSLQANLERKLIAERLATIGLSSEEIRVRVESLSDEECHTILLALNELQSGGGCDNTWAEWLAIFTLLAIFLGSFVLLVAVWTAEVCKYK
jgi:hypothetical protein